MPCLVYQNSWYICAWCGRQKHPREQQQSCPELPREPPRQASGMIWTGSTGISSVPNWNFQLVSLHKIMSMQDKFQIWGDHLRKREEVRYWYKLVYLNFFLKKGAQEIIGLGSPLDKASLQVISSITAPHFPIAGSGYPIEQECSHSLLPSVLTPASDLLQHHLNLT